MNTGSVLATARLDALERSHEVFKAEHEELYLRFEALEARFSAMESRLTRVDRLLMELQLAVRTATEKSNSHMENIDKKLQMLLQYLPSVIVSPEK